MIAILIGGFLLTSIGCPYASTTQNEKDQVTGSYGVSVRNTTWKTPHRGGMRIEQRGSIYIFQLTLEDGTQWEGVGLKQDDAIYAALGPMGTSNFVLYDIKEEELTGVLLPCDGSVQDLRRAGREVLKGGKKRNDPFSIAQGIAPLTGAEYAGSLQFTQQKLFLENREPTFVLQGTVDRRSRKGIGVQFGTKLVTCQGTAKEMLVLKLIVTEGNKLSGPFLTAAGVGGTYDLHRIPSAVPGSASAVAPLPGTVPLDLSKIQAAFPVVVFVPPQAKTTEGIAGIEIHAGDDFQIEICAGTKDLAAKKQEIQMNELGRLRRYHIEKADCLLYETLVAGKSEFHFVANIKVGARTFGVESLRGPAYSKVDVERMLRCAQTLQPKQ